MSAVDSAESGRLMDPPIMNTLKYPDQFKDRDETAEYRELIPKVGPNSYHTVSWKRSE